MLTGKSTFAFNYSSIFFSQNVKQVEYGHFRRKDRDFSNNRDNRDRGGGFRDRGGDRDRPRNQDRGGFENRGGGFRDRGGDRDNEESVFSKKVRAGKRRTYFFDVRKTKGNDYFITITESTRREDGFGYKRHKIFLYKEDFNRFVASLNEVVSHVKTDLMPEFDYEEFDRRQAEWEAQNREAEEDEFEAGEERTPREDDLSEPKDKTRPKDDDEMSW